MATIHAAPLLDGRTYNVDFSSFFLAQPVFFRENAGRMFSVIQASMNHTDFLPSCGRIVVHSDGRYITYGRTVVFSDLYAECKRKPVYNRLDNKGGREAYGFIGIVFEVTGREQPAFVLPSGMLCDLYQELIAPRWMEEVRKQPSITEMRDVEVNELATPLMDSNSIRSATGGLQRAYLCDTEDAIFKIVDDVLKLAYSGVPVSFCSDADDIRIQNRNIYNIVTCRNESLLSSLHSSDAEEKSTSLVQDESRSQGVQDKRSSLCECNDETRSAKPGSYEDQLQRIILDGRKKQSRGKPQIPFPVSQTTSDGQEKELEGFRCSGGIPINKTDAILTLGTVAGVTSFVVSAAAASGLLVLASVGVTTIIIAGIEAERLIERFKK